MRPDETGSGTRFAGYRYLEAHRCLVRDDGTEVALRPKTLETFRHLAAHADRVVGRESLHRAVWGEAVVTDDSLCKCIGEIRRAIGDTVHQVLRTVPRQGYMLVSDPPVTNPMRDAAADSPAASGPPSAALADAVADELRDGAKAVANAVSDVAARAAADAGSADRRHRPRRPLARLATPLSALIGALLGRRR